MKIVKNTSDLLPVEELAAWFTAKDQDMSTKQQIFFELHTTGQVIATYYLTYNDKKDLGIDLIVDYDSLEQLIQVHGIKRPEDLDRISLGDLWLRYLGGDGYVCADVYELEAELCFRIVKSITMVYSADLSFYQEIPHALSMTQQFERYITENMQRFGVAVLMRPMLLPEKLWLP